MNVPLLDLQAQYRSLAAPLREAVLTLIEEQKFVLGPPVEQFEREITEVLGVRFAIGCANGTDALYLSLRALDIGQGDEVVTSPFTFFATAGAIHNVGAKPVFADIDPATFNLDVAAAERVITGRTRAIIPIHLFGQMAPMSDFRALGDRRRVAIVEDAAQAIGAIQRTPDGRTITTGSLGDTCTISFFPSQNLGGFGDGGMILTNDERLAERLYRLRVHGGRQMYHHQDVGINSRLDALQAAVLSVKLPHLSEWSEARRRNASFYDEALGGLDGIETPPVLPGNVSIYNQYTIRVRDGRRDALQEELKRRGVGSAVYYPVPLHLQECFGYLGHASGDFPVAERAAEEVLSLPIFPELTEQQLSHVADSIHHFYGAS